MHRAIATVCLSGTIEEKLLAASHAGFDGIELFEPDFIGAQLSPTELGRFAADLGLEVLLYQPFRDFEGVSAAMLERNLQRAQRKFDVMEALGADLLLVCSNVSPSAIDDDQLAVEQLCKLADLAERRGIRIAYEALAWGHNVNDYWHAWSIVERAAHPALGTCLDSFHILSRGDDPDRIRRIPAEKIFFLQLADAPRLRLDVLQWSRHYRCFPGQGAFDIASLVDCALDAGYTGPLSLEVFNDVFRQADPGRTAVDAMRSLTFLEDQLQGRECTRIRRLPAAPRLTGYAFVEIAVDFRAAPPVERMLSSIGFARVGEHRSKPVELWAHGDVRVVVNRGADRARPVQIAAIALESADPAQSLARSEALLAPRVGLAHQASESEISAVLAPDGTSIFFCTTSTEEPSSWLRDFTIDATEPAPRELLRIDHVVLSQPVDCFDEAALFYRAVLGLAARDREEVASPDGLIRSRALVDETSGLRFVLNAPALGRTRPGAHAGGEQHVAFVCGDALATARAFAERGVPMLHISPNYYDDLRARLDLEEALVAEMQELGVLYDSADGGEYLHFYVELHGTRTLLEFVERRGGYSGFGAVNSPVRMAAQSAGSLVGGMA